MREAQQIKGLRPFRFIVVIGRAPVRTLKIEQPGFIGMQCQAKLAKSLLQPLEGMKIPRKTAVTPIAVPRGIGR